LTELVSCVLLLQVFPVLLSLVRMMSGTGPWWRSSTPLPSHMLLSSTLTLETQRTSPLTGEDVDCVPTSPSALFWDHVCSQRRDNLATHNCYFTAGKSAVPIKLQNIVTGQLVVKCHSILDSHTHSIVAAHSVDHTGVRILWASFPNL